MTSNACAIMGTETAEIMTPISNSDECVVSLFAIILATCTTGVAAANDKLP